MEPDDDHGSDLSRSAALHGRPTAIELLEAAKEFLASEVLPATEGSVQFHTRVTIRLLDTVARELLVGPGQAEQHTERLAQLGYGSDDDLVEAIRSGRHDRLLRELAGALEPDVRAKLEVANPQYLN
ncbi:MAG: DUF6285 domain-containing protein [Acidimicrobiales bacterium]